MKSRRRSLRISLGQQPRLVTLGSAALAAGALISPASAATQTLNTSGDWNTTSTTWDAGAVWTNGNSANFGGTASAIELAGAIQVAGISSANALVFNDAIPGGSITLVEAGSVTPTISGGQNITFNLALNGNQGLNINNAGGQVTLNSENSTFAGPVTVTAGNLRFGVNGALNGISSLAVASAGSLTTSGVNQIGTVTVTNAGTITLGGNDTVAAYVSNGGTLNGPGALRASTYALNNNSVVNGDLGNGVITANGTVALNGSTGTTGALTVQSGTTTAAANIGATTIAVSTGATLATTATGNIADAAALTLNGTAALNLGRSDTIGSLAGAGSVNLGSSTLTLSNGAAASSSAVISGTGGLTLQSGTQTLSGANTYTGATNVNGGTLALTGTLTGTTINVASGAALSSTGGLADGTNLSVTGTGAITFTAAETLATLSGAGTLSATNLTVGALNGSATINSSGTVTASAGSFGGNLATGAFLKDSSGTLTLSSSQSSIGGTTVSDGTLVLGHAFNTLADGGALTVSSGATVNLQANTDTVASFISNGGTLSGTGTLTATTYELFNNTTIDANLGTGSIVTNGTVALNGDSAAANFFVNSGVTTLDGIAAATSVAVTGGTLDITANGGLSSVAVLTIAPGATVSTSANEQIADAAGITNNGTFSVGGNETVGILDNTGTVSGTGTLTASTYNLAIGSNITGKLGAGTVNVTGDTGISGTSAATTVNVTGGTLTLTGNNLADTAVVTNSATLTVAGNDTVGTVNNTGTISGAGTLTASTYNLDAGSSISGNLGAGTVNILGATTISGTSAATTVNVFAGKALTLTGNNLADTTALVLNAASSLVLQGNETVGSFVNNAGTLDGFGTLTASAYTLNDGTVLLANLGNGNVNTNGAVTIDGLTGSGIFTVQTGTTTLTNTSAANSVNVSAGSSLILTADGEINVANAITVGSGASLTTGGVNQLGNSTLTNAGTLTLGGNDTVSAFVSNGGTYGGGFSLTALTYALNDGTTISSALGTGELTANGTVAINGSTAASIFNVQSGTTTLAASSSATDLNLTGGTLTLTGAASFNAAATVDVSTGATFNLGGSNQLANAAVVTNNGTLNLGESDDTVATFTSTGGTLSGTGELTATTYTLNNGTVIDADLGTGSITANGTVAINGDTAATTLTVQTGATTLAGASSATTVQVDTASSLLTTETGSIEDTAAVTLSGTAHLGLGQSETIGNLAGAGTVALGTSTLTIADGAGASSSAAISGTGGVTLTTGTQTFSGASTYTGATNINGGTLALTGSLASTEVNVATGAALTTTGGLADATDLVLTGTASATFTAAETLDTLNGAGTLSVTDLTVGTLNGSSIITASGVVTASDGTFTGVIATGSLVKNTAGSLTLSATQTFTGGTTVNGGSLFLTHATNTLADTGALTIQSGTTVDLAANSDTVASFTSNGGKLSGTGTLTAATYALNNGTTIDADLGAGDLTANGTVTIKGDTGTGSLTVQTGTTTHSGASSATTVQIGTAGSLVTTATGSLNDAAAVTIDGAGQLTFGQSETIGSLAGTGGSVQMGAHSLTLANGGGATSAAAISGTGGLTLTSGTQTLTGVSTYTGTTVVNGGTLNIDGANSSASLDVNGGTLVLNATSAALDADIATGATLTTGAANRLADNVVVTNNGTMNLGGNETLGALFGTGTVNLGSFNLTFAGDGDDVSGELISDFAGSISSTGTITKIGNDIQVLSGVSNYSGIAFVNDGILRVTNSGALGASGSNARTEVSGTGTLEISGGITLAEVIRPTAVGYAATFSGNDSYLTSLGAINNLADTNTLTGQIGIIGGVPDVVIGASAGTLNLTGDVIRFSGPGSPVPQLTFQTAEGASIKLTGSNAIFQLANIANVKKTGGGTLDITDVIGNNSTGDLLLHDGTVLVNAQSDLGGSAVRFGDTDRGTLRIVANSVQASIAPGAGQTVSGGDGTYADFRATVFDFANGDGTFFTEADTAIRLSNIQNFANRNILKNGNADLLIDTLGGSLAKNLPTLLINSGNVFFLAEENAGLAFAGLNGAGGNINFGSLDTTITQVVDGNYGGTLTGTGNLVINANSSATLFTSGVLSNFASVTIGGDGTGEVTLAGNSTYTGATNVATGGNLILTGTSQSAAFNIATGGTATLTASDRLTDATAVTNAGTLDLGANSDTVGSFTSNGGTLSGTGTLTAATYALNNNSVIDADLGDGAITTNGTVTINGDTGTGSLTVQTGTTTHSGASSAATVQIDTAGSLVTTATGSLNDDATVTIDGAGQLTLGKSETIGRLAGNGGAVHLGATTLTLSNGSGASSAAAIDGTGGVTLTTGTQTLSGASTYTGATNVNGGTLALTGSLVSTEINVATGAALTSTGGLAAGTDLVLTGTASATFTGAEVIDTLNGAGTLSATDLTVTTLNGTATINSSGLVTISDGAFGGNIATGNVTKTTAGTLTLSGSNATTGTITVNVGTLALANATNTLADTATFIANAGTTVDIGANTDTVGSFTSNGATLSGTGTLTATTYALNNNSVINADLGAGALTANGTVTITGDTGTGSFTVQTGTTTLSGASSAGTVQIDTLGFLVTAATGTLDDASIVTLDGGGQLTLGQSETVGSLSGTGGAIHLGATTLTLSNGGGSSAAVAIDGTGGVTLSTGTQTLSGASTYTGATNVNGGTLALTGSLVSTEINVATGAALSSTGGLADGTDLVLTGTGAATFTAAETLDTINGAGSIVSTDLTVTTLNGTALINSSGLVTVSDGAFGGNIATGNVTKTTAGTLTLSGSNATTGTITVNVGTLALANATNTLADTATFIANAGTTVDIGANTDTVGTFTSNGSHLVGTGTLTATTYTLNDASVIDADLGNGTGTVSGFVRLNASTGTGLFTILDGAELRGVGTNFGGDVVVDDGGTIAPGASPGVATIAGDWTQNGTYAAELAGLGGAGAANGNDQIVVAGDIDLGATSILAIQRFGAFGEPARGNTFRIIDGDLTGEQFGTVTTQFSTGLVLDLADGTLIGTGLPVLSTSGRVNLTKLPGIDANTIAMISAIQTDAFAGDVNGVQMNSSTGAAVPAAQAVRALLTTPLGEPSGFNKVSPEPYAGDTAYAVLATRDYADTARHTAPVVRVGKATVFTAYSAHYDATDSSVNAADYEMNGSGGILGARFAVGQRGSVGVFAGFDSGETDSTYRKGEVDGMVYGVFGELGFGEKWTATAAATLGDFDTDSTRASLTAPSATVRGVDTTAVGASVGLAYEMVKSKRGGFSPYVEFDYMTSDTDSFVETGPIDSLAVDSIDYTSFTGELGARGYIMVTERFSLQGYLGVAHEMADDETPVTARFADGGTRFTVHSPGMGSTALKAGIGADFAVTPAFTVSAGVDAVQASDADTGTSFRLGGGLSF